MSRTTPYVPMVVVGATAAAVGIACVMRDQVLILEESCWTGKEFVEAYDNRFDKSTLQQYTAQETKEMLELLKKQGAVKEGRVYLPAVSANLFELIQKNDLACSFRSVLMGIQKEKEDYLITYYNGSGVNQVYTSMLIDTTQNCITMPDTADRVKGKSLSVLVVDAGEAQWNDEEKGMKCQKGFFQGEVYLKMELAPKTKWNEAREELIRLWLERKNFLPDGKIASVAQVFQLRPSKEWEKLNANWYWIPSNTGLGFPEAFNRGICVGYDYCSSGKAWLSV